MIPLNDLLALPGGMRLDVNGLYGILSEYYKDESMRIRKKIMELVKKGESPNSFRYRN